MAKRKMTKKYYFSVEGETEKWYLDWLKDCINKTDESLYKVVFDCKIEKSPLRRVEKINITSKTEIWHLSDYESHDDFHVQQFHNTIDELSMAKKLGKKVDYKFGYSNYTFDLWMVLHKDNCNGPKSHRHQYLYAINKGYEENFLSMKDYKHEHHFQRCLEKLELKDVINAINRSKLIMETNKKNGLVLQKYKGYSYYRENPSLMIWQIIEKILLDCHLMSF